MTPPSPPTCVTTSTAASARWAAAASWTCRRLTCTSSASRRYSHRDSGPGSSLSARSAFVQLAQAMGHDEAAIASHPVHKALERLDYETANAELAALQIAAKTTDLEPSL